MTPNPMPFSSFLSLSKHVCVMNHTQTQGPLEGRLGFLVTTSLNWNAAHSLAPAPGPGAPRCWARVHWCAEYHKDLILHWKVKKKGGGRGKERGIKMSSVEDGGFSYGTFAAGLTGKNFAEENFIIDRTPSLLSALSRGRKVGGAAGEKISGNRKIYFFI